ncbi:MAG: hypothetical protein LIO62_02195 [Clostridiales bacterium]|nr:hypothetical protein [Clostridiales bacterium]
MPIKFSDMFGSVEGSINNPKLEEVLNKTKDAAEKMGKKSAERIDISRKQVECFDAKSKLSKSYEKYGQLQYLIYIGEEVDSQELESCTNRIGELRQKIDSLSADIEEAKAAFNESISNATKRTREAFSQHKEQKSDNQTNDVDKEAEEFDAEGAQEITSEND